MEEQNDIQKTAVAPQKTAVMPQKTAVMPQKTAVMPQKTAVMPQKTAAMPQKTAVAGGQVPTGGNAGPAAVADTITAGGKTYKVEKVIGSGTEGDIYIVSSGSKRYALKRCHAGFHTNKAVMPALQKLKGKGYIADIIDYADDFELLEFVPEGSVASANLKGNAQAILAIAVKTAMSLSEMHKVGIIHKDVKPANILVKNKQTWDCVLCDFGIADVLNSRGSVSTPQVRTPIYAAPEVYGKDNTIVQEGVTYCELTPKADFYSLGMSILSLWMGEGAFLSKEAELAIDKTKGRITIPADMPDPLAKICRGLLIKNADKRWDLGEIERTLKGEDVPVDETAIIEDLNIVFSAAKHLTANTPEELAYCMGEDYDLAVKYLYRGQIEKWLKPYPELVVEIQDIVEKRFPKDQELGTYAAMCLLNPAKEFYLAGTSRETGEEVERWAITLKDVSDFCNEALPNDETADILSSDYFCEWVRVRNAAIVDNFPPSNTNDYTDVYMLRVQMIDPLSDINLRNDTSHPDYAMTGESIGRFLNKVYNIYWNTFEGDVEKMFERWGDREYAPLNQQISANTLYQITRCFVDPQKNHYLTSFMNTKGNRFKDQVRFYLDATDENSDDYRKKAGPKTEDFFIRSSWMKVIKGYGATPEYEFTESHKTVTTISDVFRESKKVLKKEFEVKGLEGFLAVNRMEDPTADLRPQFAYEKLLKEYVDDLAKIDDKMEPVTRFRFAVKEAERLLSDGKARIRNLNTRNIVQYVSTMIFAVLPAVVLLLMLVLSIIENPIVDTSSLTGNSGIFWTIGLIIAFIGFAGGGGCIGGAIIGAIGGAIIFYLVKFLGQYVLYFYTTIVVAVLAYFSYHTIFLHAEYTKEAKKFTKPGFEEKVLEPLYYAFSNDSTFDSSLNGAFNDDYMGNWRSFLKARRVMVIAFICITWFLLIFSMFIPHSERFSRIAEPVTAKVAPMVRTVVSLFSKNRPNIEEDFVAPTMSFETLAPGGPAEQIVELQNFLINHGYATFRPDGDYGKRTKRAVRDFQREMGLEQTGICDQVTVQAMNQKLWEEARAAFEEQNYD